LVARELGFLPATTLAALVRRGAVGCLELLDHFIARVERLDPKLNAVAVRDFERARQTARTMDRQRRKGAARRPTDDMSADAVMVQTVDMPHRDWPRLNERRFQVRPAVGEGVAEIRSAGGMGVVRWVPVGWMEVQRCGPPPGSGRRSVRGQGPAGHSRLSRSPRSDCCVRRVAECAALFRPTVETAARGCGCRSRLTSLQDGVKAGSA